MAIIRKSIYNKWGESVEKREPSSSVGGNVNWYNLYGEQYWGSFYHKTPLGIYSKKTLIQKYMCTPTAHCSTIYNSQDAEAI